MKGADSMKNTKKTREIMRGTEENTQTNKNDHICARSMNTKGDTRSKVNNG